MKFKELAIIGATASGKTELALKKAKETNSYILSIDSLSVYKEIDIVSAKPTQFELSQIKHFGINEIAPNEKFDVTIFIDLYKKAKSEAIQNGKNIIIVGGTSFYLKTLLTGISKLPKISENTTKIVDKLLEDLQTAYSFLETRDFKYSQRIKSNDKYRIEKALNILVETGESPTIWFQKNPPEPIIQNLEIFNIQIERAEIIQKIEKRTKIMLENGLVDEVKTLLLKYGQDLQPNKAIGIRETIQYLNNEIDKNELMNLISIHTRQLAKRQTTFNRTQFSKDTKL